MKKVIKKVIVGAIGLVFLFTNIGISASYASEADNLEIAITPNPNIDVVLTVGDTKMDVSNFSIDLKRELAERGIDTSKVKIEAVDTTIISTDDSDAERIFNEWDSFPFNGPMYWRYDSVNKWITTDYNEPYETGFINMDGEMPKDYTLETLVQRPDTQQPVGFIFRMHPNGQGGNRWNMYYLWISDDRYKGNNKTVITLFKVEGQNLDYLNRTTHRGTYSATPLMRYNGNLYGWPYHEPYDYGGFPHGTPQQRGLTVTNIVDPYLKTTILDFVEIPISGTLDWTKVRLEVVSNTFKVYINDNKLLEYTDNNNPYEKGYYGVFAYSHVSPKFKNVYSEKKTYKKFTEVIRQPEWRENSYRFLVNAEDDILPEMNDPQDSGEILTRLINEEIDYVSLGTNANRQQALNLIAQNNGEGTFIDNSNYNFAIEQLADYIANEVRSEQQRDGDSQYVLVGESLNIEVIPPHLRTNTQTPEYPQGRWRVDHDYEYFESNLGQYVKSGQYQPDLDFVFDKPGKYEIWFADKHPVPRYVYVHRRPIANFSLQIVDNGNHYTVNINDMSYDLDALSQPNKGIAEHEWKWKETTATTWNNGVIPSNLPKGKDYVVQLRVKDAQGVWSIPVSRYITTSNVITEPVANFNIPQNATKYENVNVENLSYDPAGRNLTETLWTVIKNGTTIYSGSSPITNFMMYGEGKYKVSLKVKNDAGLWSEEFSRYITITSDEIEPEAIINPTRSDDTNQNITVTASFIDKGGSGFDVQRYAVTNTPSFPTSGWSAWDNKTTRTITLSNEGIWYIHIEAKDKEGNIMRRTVGEYRIDKTAPNSPSFTASETKPTNQNVVVTIHYPADAEQKLVKVGDKGIWMDYAEPIVLSENNVIYAKAQDKAGNWSQEANYAVNNIDKIAPDAPSLKADVIVPTNKNVTVTITYPMDVSVKQVKVGKDGLWTNYTAPVVVTENTTVYARAVDEAGNVSEEASITVNNIDKVPPTAPTIKQDVDVISLIPGTDERNGIADTKIRINGGEWRSYTAPIKLNDGEYIIEAKSIDGVGNESSVTIHIYVYDDTLKKAQSLVSNAEKYPTQSKINQAKEVVLQLPDVAPEKRELLERLSNLEYQLLLEDATKKVKLAENYLREPYVSNAFEAVHALPDGEDKNALLERLNVVVENMKKGKEEQDPDQVELVKKVKEATEKVALAERMKREPYISQAEELVNALPNGDDKNALKERLDHLKQELEQEEKNKLLQEAERKVEQAELYKREPYISNAFNAVNALFDSAEKEALLDRLRAITSDDDGEEEQPPKDGQFEPGDNIVEVADSILDPMARKVYLDWAKAVERAEKYFSKANIEFAIYKMENVPIEVATNEKYKALYEEMMHRTMVLKQLYNDMVANKELERAISKAVNAVETYENFKTEASRMKAQAAVDALPDGEVKEMLQQRIDAVSKKN